MIKLWINKKSWELDSWDVLIKKTTRLKTKAKIQAFTNYNIDQCYHGSNQSMSIRLAKKPYKEHYKKAHIKHIENFYSIK